jgi:hypothetical protein
MTIVYKYNEVNYRNHFHDLADIFQVTETNMRLEHEIKI